MLKSSLLFFAAAALAAVLVPVAGHNPQAATPAQAASQKTLTKAQAEAQAKAEAQTKAKALYQRDCALCHNDNGDGKTSLATSMNLTLDNWTDSKTLANLSDSDLFNTVRNGKGSNMPAEDPSRANDTELKDVIAYIRTLSSAPAPAPASTPAPPAN